MIVYAIKLMLNGKNCLMVRIKNLLLTTRTQKQYLDQASQLFGLFLKKVRIFLFGSGRFVFFVYHKNPGRFQRNPQENCKESSGESLTIVGGFNHQPIWQTAPRSSNWIIIIPKDRGWNLKKSLKPPPTVDDMGVSKNSGTPKRMVYNGKLIKMDDLGVPVFSETAIYSSAHASKNQQPGRNHFDGLLEMSKKARPIAFFFKPDKWWAYKLILKEGL